MSVLLNLLSHLTIPYISYPISIKNKIVSQKSFADTYIFFIEERTSRPSPEVCIEDKLLKMKTETSKKLTGPYYLKHP